jgi:hypothetical protein
VRRPSRLPESSLYEEAVGAGPPSPGPRAQDGRTSVTKDSAGDKVDGAVAAGTMEPPKTTEREDRILGTSEQRPWGKWQATSCPEETSVSFGSVSLSRQTPGSPFSLIDGTAVAEAAAGPGRQPLSGPSGRLRLRLVPGLPAGGGRAPGITARPCASARSSERFPADGLTVVVLERAVETSVAKHPYTQRPREEMP